MDNSEFYFDAPNVSNKDVVINSLLNDFLAARERAKFPTNKESFDEDVNLYIAHLLFAISMPNYNGITEQYISLRESEVRVLADMAEDKYLKYFIFKVNADNLLVHLGIFQDLLYSDKPKTRSKTEKQYLEDAQAFYDEAAQLNKKIYRRKTAIAEVLMKLSKNLPQYAKALSFMRKTYFLFHNRFEDNEFSEFLDHMKTYEKRMELEKKQNVFLDLYSQWLEKKTPSLRQKINSICQELHEIDPSFTFSLD